MAREHAISTLGVRAGTVRSQFNEHSEALYLTSSFVFENAAQAPELAARVAKQFGKVRGGDPTRRKLEMVRVATLLKKGKGDVKAGQLVYTNNCAKCHKLFGEGGEVGPELTGYERTNPVYWMENILDPSAVIREEISGIILKTIRSRGALSP